MKKITALLISVLIAGSVFGQVAGNINYQNQTLYSNRNIDIAFPSSSDLFVKVKGMANVKADAYVAIFSVSQAGKTAEEVNKLIDERINKALETIKINPKIESYVDMISFVPLYEYEVEKKIFSKKTYNEIPAGFELKKNIHIKYFEPNMLNEIITALSKAEIYNLVRVDYFSNNLEAVKKELSTKAKTILQEKVKNYETILSMSLDSTKKQLNDGYKVVLPVEEYKSYRAYSNSSLNFKKSANIMQADKSTTLYYQPVIDKEFDFVINPTIFEPVIQVMYEIKLIIKREKEALPKVEKTSKKYILISPKGEIKELNIE